MRILIAEDDPVSLKVLQTMLVKWGYEVVATTDGQTAYDTLQADHTLRLAVIDWMMPALDGVGVCRALRNRPDGPYVYVLLLTAKSEKQELLEAMSAGADDYICKPFDPKELQARLRAAERLLDLQVELVRAHDNMRQQATHDPLTGLPNRLLFRDRLTQKLADERRRHRSLAVMFVDLDHFKRINDTFGHAAGDLFLVGVTDRLQGCLREGDTFARMGGDEFTIILADVSSSEEVVMVAERVREALSDPIIIEGQELLITASIGISMFPSDGDDVETLVRNADTAMYRAKERGKNGWQFYRNPSDASSLSHISLEQSLRAAVGKGELVLHYQPRVDMRTGRILGAEALVRWRHPSLGLISPAHFIPLAEESGLIEPIGEWILREACTQNRAWQDAGLVAMEVGVNVSPHQLWSKNLPATIATVLQESGLGPQFLCLEITESTLIQNPGRAEEVLPQFRAMGLQIALDDFGTGYSSLGYLKRFPIDVVKIDQSFVRGIPGNPDDAGIAGAAVAMAHSLRLRAVAEGVETWEQLEFLRSINCDEMQGYFVNRPVLADEFMQIAKATALLPEARRTSAA